MAVSPLEPRHGSVGVWTGEELLVVGGDTGFVCPPGADCVSPDPDGFRADGAAYDPVTDTWRRIADAPRAFVGGTAAWTGSTMVVTTGRGALVYDPAADVWRDTGPSPITSADQTLLTDRGVLFVSYEQRRGSEPSDWLFVPSTEQWEAVPRDPFGESYDRSLASDGERLWLLSMSVENHFGAYRGASSRVAVLEDDAWRVVDDETPDITQGQLWWWAGDRLVVTPGRYSYARTPARAFDGTGWTALGVQPDSRPDDPGCALGAAGVGLGWVAGGGPSLVSAATGQVLDVPDCDDLAQPDVTVWAGDELLLWGGPSADFDPGSLGLRWTPPAVG